jgi:hypothetical protein
VRTLATERTPGPTDVGTGAEEEIL